MQCMQKLQHMQEAVHINLMAKHFLILHIGDRKIKWHSFDKSKHWRKTSPEIKNGIWYGWCSIIKWLKNKGETCRKYKN